MGDFNAHNPLWGCRDINSKGQHVENFLLQTNMCLLNDKSARTYLHPATGSLSSIDLTIVDPTLYLDISWSVLSDQHGSDHFPIKIECTAFKEHEPLPRWNLNRANWALYIELCNTEINYDLAEPNNNTIERFTAELSKLAEKAIPVFNRSNKVHHKPWFNTNCRDALAERKKALKTFRRLSNTVNLDNYRKCRAKARQTVRAAKRLSWREYVSKLNTKTPMKKVWKMVRRISGKTAAAPVKHVSYNGSVAENPVDIANALGCAFASNSSSDHYTAKFNTFRTRAESKPLVCAAGHDEAYNALFTLSELQAALKKSHNTAVGPDNIHYQMLTHLPDTAQGVLLAILNDMWTSGLYPRFIIVFLSLIAVFADGTLKIQ